MDGTGNTSAHGLKPSGTLVLPVLVLFCGLAATALTVYLVQENAQVRNEQRFTEQSAAIERAISTRMEAYIGLLRGGAGFFAAIPNPTLAEFRQFYERLNIAKNYPGVRGFGYTRRFSAAELPEVVAAGRRIHPDFRVWPDHTRDEYHSIIYLEPLDERNLRAIGFDMFTEDTRRTAMEAARDGGDVAMSGNVRLVQETGLADQEGFLLYVPIYDRGGIPPTLELRRELLRGYIYTPFRAGDLFDAMLRYQREHGVRLAIWNGTNAVDDHLLYKTRDFSPKSRTRYHEIEMAGRIWTLGFQPPAPAPWGHLGRLTVVPLLGLTATLLLSYVTWRDTHGRERLRQLADDLYREVEQRKRAEEETRQLNQELELRVQKRTAALQESTEQMEAFTYTVAHDLRAPLRAMQGFSHALSEEYGKVLDATATDYLRRVMTASEKMDQLIQDLLAYSHLSRSNLSFTAVPLRDVVANVLLGHHFDAHRRKARITVEVENISVNAHAATLEHAISNLVANALKFTRDSEPPQVRIFSSAMDERIRITIEDQGIGVAPEHQERIFRVFERLHNEHQYPGTGIGLAIVKKGVERMGGRVGVSSVPGQGSAFWIELPKAG